ncbi:MAG: class I SAM-dependent methyltransferase [Planctomycetes bacterium]|nr:class I SAM-dependent methyltransferase [Planctomycetota bacterium]
MPLPLLRDEPWYARTFDRAWLRLYAHRNDAEARDDAPAVVRHLGVHPGQRVLDVACGAGRYARALSSLGLRVTGVDLSADLLTEARERSPLLPGAPQYVRGDARHLPFSGQFQGAISMFTSFGYFAAREDDVAIFRGVRRALVPGGRFLVDFLHASHVRSTLEPKSSTRQGTLRIDVEREIDEDAPEGPVVRKHLVARDAGSGQLVAEFDERVRLYLPAEVDALLVEADLELVGDRMGHVDGRPLTDDAPRYVRIARRPR